jgi:hypothetical protein
MRLSTYMPMAIPITKSETPLNTPRGYSAPVDLDYVKFFEVNRRSRDQKSMTGQCTTYTRTLFRSENNLGCTNYLFFDPKRFRLGRDKGQSTHSLCTGETMPSIRPLRTTRNETRASWNYKGNSTSPLRRVTKAEDQAVLKGTSLTVRSTQGTSDASNCPSTKIKR